MRLHPHNFLYDPLPIGCDSGGAIVVAGKVIGLLHKEVVNAARQLLEHKTTAGERLSRVEVDVLA